MIHISALYLAKKRSLWIPLAKDLALGLIASFIVSLAAPLAIHLPFSPIPLSLQVHILLFLALFLSPRQAFFTVLLFLIQGLEGYPVFAGGAAGLATLLGPRGGYLIGYLVGAPLVSYLRSKNKNPCPTDYFMEMGAGTLLIYLFGASYLSVFLGIQQAIILGVVPFILGDLMKLMVFARLGKAESKIKYLIS